MRKIGLRVFTLMVLVSCAQTSRRLKLDQVGNVNLNNLVHPKIMEWAGVEQRSLPAKERNNSQLEQIYADFIADTELYEKPVSGEMAERLRVIKFVPALSRGDAPGVVATCNRYFLKFRQVDGGSRTERWTEIEVHEEKAAAFQRDDQDPYASGGEDQGNPGEPSEDIFLRLKMLVYHELFHCLYNRGHLQEGYGIMSETLLKMDDLPEKKWLGMVRNMFTYQFDLTEKLYD